MTRKNTVDRHEIDHFSKDSARWWDEAGPFAPLHKMNPARLSYIRDMTCRHFGDRENAMTPLSGLSVVDIGCGGGLVCEPLARMGAAVTGIDADPVAINVAKDHAASQGLAIDYRCAAAEDINESCDIVLALEIIEHVADPAAFIDSCAALCKPGGLVILSTPNRTAESFLKAIIAAEYVLRWVPAGTHNWRKFLRPSETARLMRASGLTPVDENGLYYNALEGKFYVSDKGMGVNYFITARKS